jgi:hypothetical protein
MATIRQPDLLTGGRIRQCRSRWAGNSPGIVRPLYQLRQARHIPTTPPPTVAHTSSLSIESYCTPARPATAT